jgi:hypothetical protein
VKNIQGPARTCSGGDAVPGSQGNPPVMVRARAIVHEMASSLKAF